MSLDMPDRSRMQDARYTMQDTGYMVHPASWTVRLFVIRVDFSAKFFCNAPERIVSYELLSKDVLVETQDFASLHLE